MIRVSSIQKRYGSICALKNVSLTVERGQIVGFVGPNGSGKSTTLRIIAGLERPDQGRCTVDGVEARRISDSWSKVATLLDRQGVNGELTAVQAMRALAAAYAVPSSRVDTLLQTVGLDYAKHRKARSFSLGMKQRLNIALALLAQPNYLILDEPMNGLDPDGILWLRDFLSEYRCQGGGVLLSSHTLSEVQVISDSFVVIKNGVSVWQGSKGELAKNTLTQVAALEPHCLREVLTRCGYDFECTDSGVVVRHVSAKELGPQLVSEGVPLTCLKEVNNSLEDLYVSLSNESDHR